MSCNQYSITKEERQYLRELAKRQLEYAKLPENEEKKDLWYKHNMLQGMRPLIVMEELTFESEILPKSRCESPLAKLVEHTINRQLVSHELVNDDKVIPDEFILNMTIDLKEFDCDFTVMTAKEKSVAYQYQHIISNLEEDYPKLKHSIYSYSKEIDQMKHDIISDAIGDILPVRLKNRNLEWHLTPTFKAVKLMGLENFMIEMISNPDIFHKLMEFLVKDLEDYLDWMEKENLLTMNNGNDYVGAGSYGFTHELHNDTGKVTTKDLWCNLNSQESSSISPEMYGEFIFPYYKRLAQRFGLTYYGCCEPVHAIWKDYLSTIPNLRKVSISAWCDEDYMGEALKGTKTIYSRKPSPNFIGVGKHLDEDAFRQYIKKTLSAAKGCEIEFIFRDIYTLSGDITKPGRAVQIVRQLI